MEAVYILLLIVASVHCRDLLDPDTPMYDANKNEPPQSR